MPGNKKVQRIKKSSILKNVNAFINNFQILSFSLTSFGVFLIWILSEQNVSSEYKHQIYPGDLELLPFQQLSWSFEFFLGLLQSSSPSWHRRHLSWKIAADASQSPKPVKRHSKEVWSHLGKQNTQKLKTPLDKRIHLKIYYFVEQG